MPGTVLLLDQDLGFVFWLGRVLEKFGYEAYPAKSVRDAFELIPLFHLDVSLLIVKRSMPEAYFLIKWLRSANKDLRVILTGENEGTWVVPWEADAHCGISAKYGEGAEQEWNQLIRNVFLQNFAKN